MNCDLAYCWDEALASYDLGRDHPLAPVRVRLAHLLIEEFGILDRENVGSISHIKPVKMELLREVHTPEFIEAVIAASDGSSENMEFGLGSADVPVFEDMHRASSLVCGASVAAAEAVFSGQFNHSVNLSGGLHHAMRNKASGFCVYNDIALAIQWLLDQGVERIAYIDVDVHHGDGVQEIFYNDPRVTTISIHESGHSLFPGTGFADEIGGPDAKGSAVNVALRAGTSDQEWVRAFESVVPQIIEVLKPEYIVSQHGCDSHLMDPLSNMRLSIEAQRWSYQRIHELAHSYSNGRWLAYGGGGYDWVNVVPRAWTHLTAIAAGAPIDPSTEIPEAWRLILTSVTNELSPRTMGDGVNFVAKPTDNMFDPLTPIDRSILRTRDAVFPFYGLDPEPSLY